jgi:hypothetical protein
MNQGDCYNLKPTFNWIKDAIYSIVVVFTIAFVPFFAQGQQLRYLSTPMTDFFQNSLNGAYNVPYSAWRNTSSSFLPFSRSYLLKYIATQS